MTAEHDTSAPLQGIAIVGLAGRFPGADDVQAFWDNLLAARETISTLRRDDIAAGEPVDDADYVPRRGLIEQAEWFDAPFFGMSRIEAEVTDPQQRVFLEVAWTALEHAGYDAHRLPGTCGVWAGTGNNHYLQKQLSANASLLETAGSEAVMIGSEKDYIATRVAYKLNLRGPAINVVTACSTSLVAVAQAVHALQTFQCDMALAGGASIRWPQNRGYLHQEGNIFSPDGHCRAFDEQSAGTVFSSGAGCVVLKRAEDAVRDGDTIYALIRSAALNNDGAGKVSFTAPGVDGQAENVTMAIALADVPADSIDYVEAHGTGTALGDVIEVAALTQAFRACGDERVAQCGLGSLKTATGHMDAAAGVSGLIKTALALHHGTIPATLHFQRPNPKLDLEQSPFRVIAAATPFPTKAEPNRALVAALGVGGTNAHVLVENALVSRPAPAAGASLLVLSARSDMALAAMQDRLATFLEKNPGVSLADVASTLAHGRSVFETRAVIAAESVADAVAKLRGAVVPIAANAGRPLAFLFPGQGSQHAGIASELRKALPLVDEVLADITSRLGFDPLAGTDDELAQTSRTQPALFAIGYALAKQLAAWGLVPEAMLGHSIGEYVAATLAGVFSLDDALKLVTARGRLMQAQPTGVMLAVRAAEADFTLPPELDLAAVNGPALCVVSGTEEAIAAFERDCEAKGLGTKRLRTSHAFHSRLMDGALDEFRRAFDGVTLHPPTQRVISNETGTELTAEQATSPDYWVRHLRGTVRFHAGVASLKEAHACLEVGPGNVLTQLAKQAGTTCFPTLPPAKDGGRGEHVALLQALGHLWATGHAFDLEPVVPFTHRIALPTYPFERQRYCPDSVSPSHTPSRSPSPPPAPLAAVSRKAHLISELQAQLLKISGIDVSTSPATTAFLDLGFDSLFLTQAGMALKKHFGVKITFRQLMEELTSIDALATHLDASLPPGAFEPKPATPATPAPIFAEPGSEPAPTGLDARLSRIEAALAQLTGAPLSTPAAPSAGVPHFSVKVSEQKGAEGKKIAFGPFRQIEKSKDGSLTPEQQAHLRELIASYCAKYAKTKQFTAENRPHFADPRAVGGFSPLWKEMVFPAVTDRSQGAFLWDVDGNQWIDVVHGFGSGFFGHRPQFVVDALKAQLDKGYEIGPTHPLAGEVARMICEFSGQERVAFSNTGSESLMAAIRVARTVTGRDKVAMFAGAYHGIFDEVLARPLVSNGELRSIPIAPGIPESAQANLIVLEYGHPESLEIIKRHGHELAAVLVEPVPSRRPDIAPYEFVRELRRITQETETAMIFDEVVLGWRTCPEGAQKVFGIDADLVAYGKVVGGGMPLGVLAGKRRFMDALDGGDWRYGDDSAPEVGVTFFAGTFIRHPLTLAACKAVLDKLKADGPALQQRVEQMTIDFCARLDDVFVRRGVPVKVTRFSSLWMLNADPGLKYYSLLFYHLRLRGIHIWEGRGNFISTAHTETEIAAILSAFEESVIALQHGGFFPGGDGGALPAPSTLPAVAKSLPVTPEQQELFLASRLSLEASVAAHESITLRIDGPLDVAKLKGALAALAARHDSLRTHFSADGAQQVIEPRVDVPLREVEAADVTAVAADDFDAPFDLTRGPLWRATLVTHGPAAHSLLVTAHHTVCDGWSFGVIAHDLAALYRGDSLEAAPTASAALETERDPATEAHWLAEYATAPATLELPTDRPRTPLASLDAGTLRGRFSASLAAQLRDFCRAEKLTPNAVLLTAWQILLHRLSGEQDVIVGTPMAGQLASGLTDFVGHRVHFLPLRQNVSPEATARELLASTRGKLADATDHQAFTLGQLYQKASIPRQPGRPSFVTNSFTLETPPEPLQFGAARAELTPNAKRKLAFDLALFVIHGCEETEWQLVHRTAYFDEPTVAAWMRSYEQLLSALVSAPGTAVGQLPILSPSDAGLMLREWNHLPAPKLPEQGIHELFSAQAARTPKAVALHCRRGKVTYEQLERRANQFAHELIEAGVRPKQMVALFADRTLEMVAAVLGILKAGAVYAPVDPNYPADRIAFMLDDLNARFVVTNQANFTLPPGAGAHHVVITITADTPTRFVTSTHAPEVPVLPSSPAYVIYTSGSTGRPKGTVVPHRAVVRLVRNQTFCTMGADETWLQLAPLSFDASTLELWAPLLNGGSLALMPPGTPSLGEIGGAIVKNQVTSVWLTAGLFQLMVEEQLESFAPLRQLLTGGDVVSLPHARRVLGRFPQLRLVNGYGPTENTTFTCCHTITPADLERPSLPIGKPVVHTTAHVVDASGQPCPLGVPGELLTGGEGLALGYWHRDELTAEKFAAHPDFGRVYRTGDRVRWLAGGVLEFLGRADTQIKVRGFRIEPGEIESALLEQPGVKQAAVIARGDSAGDKRLVAYCVPSGAGIDAGALVAALRGRLPDYMVPQAVVPMPQGLPLSPNGKIDTRALPDPVASTAEATSVSPTGVIAPRTPVEQRVYKLMEEALGRNSFGVTCNFFDLGGDSLRGLRLFTRIEREFGRALPLGTLFAAPTVEKLAALLGNARTDLPEHVIPIQPEGSQPPLFLVHGGDGGVMFYRKAVAQLPKDQPVLGIEAPMLTDASILSPGGSVEEIATRYVALVREVQPRGPYRLGGYSFGGIVAFDMARKLREAGEEVDWLVLFDTDNPSVQPRWFSHMERIAARWRMDAEHGLSTVQRLQNMALRIYWGYRERLKLRREASEMAAARADGRRATVEMRPIEIREAHMALMDCYKPVGAPGRLTLVRCMGKNDKFEHTRELGWEGVFADGTEVLEVTGTHLRLFDEPHVNLLAEKLARHVPERSAVPA